MVLGTIRYASRLLAELGVSAGRIRSEGPSRGYVVEQIPPQTTLLDPADEYLLEPVPVSAGE